MTRDVLIIAGVCVVAILVGAGVFFMSGDSGAEPTAEETPVAIRVLSEGANATTDLKKNYRVVNEEQLEQIWALAHGQTIDALPRVDFATEEVLAVFGGEHSTGGYSISVESVVDGEDRKVVIAHIAPDSSCIVTQAMTSPFQIVVVPKTDKALDRTDRTVTVACS